jgi:hypothetical protein
MGYWTHHSNVPTSGWEHEGVTRSDEDAVCEWCEQQQIRYIHYLSHIQWPDSLSVGCVCATKLTGGGKKAADQEKRAKRKHKSLQTKRDKFSKSWKTSKNGNQYTAHKGIFMVLVFQRGQWKCGYRRESSDSEIQGVLRDSDVTMNDINDSLVAIAQIIESK